MDEQAYLKLLFATGFKQVFPFSQLNVKTINTKSIVIISGADKLHILPTCDEWTFPSLSIG